MFRTALLLAGFAATAAARPADGVYTAHAFSSQLGPNLQGTLWKVASVEGTKNWWLRDVFTQGHIVNSYQQFWVSEDSLGQLTYCGHLRHYGPRKEGNADGNSYGDVMNMYYHNTVASTGSSRVWCAEAQAGGCSLLTMNMTVTSAKAFTLLVTMGGAVHFDAVLTLSPDTVFPNTAQDHRDCQVASSKVLGYGFGGVDTDRTSDNSGTLPQQPLPVPPSPPRPENSYCYVLHAGTQFTVSWRFVEHGKVAMRISAITGGGWAALGFYPSYPGMLGAKILAGLPGVGVKVMEAKTFLGTPEPSAWTNVTDDAVTTEDSSTTFTATFTPPKPERPMMEVYWAVGAGQTGFDYHGYNRGMVSLLLSRPEWTIPSWLRC